MGPHGTAAASRAAIHSEVVRSGMAAEIAAANASRLATRARLFEKARVVGERGKAGDGAELAELAIRADGDDDVPVTGGESLIWHDIRVGIAETRRRTAADEIVERLVGEHGDLRIQQREVDELAFTGAVAVMQGGEDADRRVKPGEDVGEGDAAFHRSAARLAVGSACHAHDAAHTLNHEIVAGPLGVGACLAEAGYRTVDQAGIEAAQGFIIESELLQAADLEVLDDHVGLAGEIAEEGLAGRLRHVDGD
jgi:hypothetical protein